MPIFKPNIQKLAAKRDLDGLSRCVDDEKLDFFTRVSAGSELSRLGDKRAVPFLLRAYFSALDHHNVGSSIEVQIINILGTLSQFLGIDLASLCPDLYDFNSSHYQTFKYFLPSDNEPILKELAKYTKSDQAHKFITYILIDNIMQGERFREVKGHEIDFGASWLPIYQHTANEIAKKGEAAYQPLIDYLSSKEESLVVKRIAVLSLGMLKNEKAIEPLANLLKTPQDNTHSLDLFIAHALLFEIGGERCIDIIVNYIKENHDRAYLWQESQRVLSDQLVDKVGYRKSDIWLSQLKDNVILGHIADNSLDLIIKRLDSLCWKPQNDEFSVYFWIGKQNKDEVIKMGEIAVLPLINILEGNFKDSLVAAHSLVEIGDKRAVKPLINFYRENIKRYKGSTFINIFDKLLEWPGLEEPSQNEIKLILDEIKAYLELEESITSFSDMFGIDRTGRFDPLAHIGDLQQLKKSSPLAIAILRSRNESESVFDDRTKALAKIQQISSSIHDIRVGKRIVQVPNGEGSETKGYITIATDGAKYYQFIGLFRI